MPTIVSKLGYAAISLVEDRESFSRERDIDRHTKLAGATSLSTDAPENL
ncbi:MAG: hypothetical protein IBJ03_16590 [Gemmatimonadaceae bacterium]|nr:hypothetical protein [Gemmatimonadaceae bacterium]